MSTDIVDTKARQVVLHVVRNYKVPTNLGTYLSTSLARSVGTLGTWLSKRYCDLSKEITECLNPTKSLSPSLNLRVNE